MVVGAINATAIAVFAVVLCWRIDKLRRSRGEVQSIALTISITAFTLAFLLLNRNAAERVDEFLYLGFARSAGYGLLALGVAGLSIVLFAAPTESARQRRAGVEAVPLIFALVGLNTAMAMTPLTFRTASLSELTVQEWGLAGFFIIGGTYLVYGLGACVRSLWRLTTLAGGQLRIALRIMGLGLAVAALGSLVQVVFIVLGILRIVIVHALLPISFALSWIGVVTFVVGLSYPVMSGTVQKRRYRRQHQRDFARLEPLWREVTAAVPEIVLPTPITNRSSTRLAHLRFQRRVVEIRDALIQLSPYLTQDFGSLGPQENLDVLADAIDTYRAAGRVTGETKVILKPDGPGIDADAAPLLTLSDQIAHVKAASTHS